MYKSVRRCISRLIISLKNTPKTLNFEDYIQSQFDFSESKRLHMGNFIIRTPKLKERYIIG